MITQLFCQISNKWVVNSRNTKKKVYCSMDLRKFPHDVQHCEMIFESYNFDTSSVKFKLLSLLCDTTVVEECDKVLVLQSSAFEVVSISIKERRKFYDFCEQPILSTEIIFRRQLSYYFYQVC